MNVSRGILQLFLKNIHQKGFFHLFSANILIQLFAFASQLLVAGILAPDDLGRIKIIQTYLAIFSIIGAMGFSGSTLKLCSERNVSIRERNLIFQSAIFFTAVSSICVYLIVLLFNRFGILSSDRYIQYLIPLGLLPVITNTIFMVFVAYTQATKRIKLMSKLTIFNRLISIIGIILFTLWLGIEGYYIAFNLSFIIMLFVCFLFIYRFSFKNRFAISVPNIRAYFPKHWKYARPSMLANLSADIVVYIDIILINFFVKDMHDIGFYGFALTLTVAFRLFPSTVQQISTPYFSSFSDNKPVFVETYKRYNKMLYAVILLTLAAACLLVPVCIDWIFSGKYNDSMPYFYLLAIGWSFFHATQLQSAAIFGLGKIQYNVYINLISIAFNLITLSVSLYFFGLIGAACASILNNGMYLLVSTVFLKKAIREM